MVRIDGLKLQKFRCWYLPHLINSSENVDPQLEASVKPTMLQIYLSLLLIASAMLKNLWTLVGHQESCGQTNQHPFVINRKTSTGNVAAVQSFMMQCVKDLQPFLTVAAVIDHNQVWCKSYFTLFLLSLIIVLHMLIAVLELEHCLCWIWIGN